jgi:hypothetical protein
VTYRILVTGSRDWADELWLAHKLDAAVSHFGADNAVIVHGACPTGADQLADQWCETYAIKVERHPADWKQHGRSAGFLRNAEMVMLGADLCLAFINPCISPKCRNKRRHDSHGATHCADLAEKAGIETRRYRP